MLVDESGAPWPYGDTPSPRAETQAPSWECPGGLCHCHPQGSEAKRVSHTLHLFDHRIERLEGARCRVVENGRMINTDQPYADSTGVIVVQVLPSTKVLLIEWAPADVPVTPRYPFRKRYFVDLGKRQGDRVERRLHNIGYSAYGSLNENIEDYQAAYGPPGAPTTGRPEHVETKLSGHHDRGELTPPSGTTRGADLDGGSSVVLAVAPQQPTSEEPPAQPPIAQQPRPLPSVQAPPAPGPGPSKSGSVAPVIGKLTITLGAFFSMHVFQLQEKDLEFTTPPAGWKDHAYDVEAMLKHYYYPNKNVRGVNQRSWKSGSVAIVGATVTIRSTTRTATVATDKNGELVFPFVQGEGNTDLALHVQPPPGQLNPTGRPAGPDMTDKDTKATWYFRPFTINLQIFPTGVLKVLFLDPTKPPWFAKSLGVTSNTARGTHVTIDWRPDWIAPSDLAKLNNTREIGDNKAVQNNPFDISTPEKRKLAAEEGRAAVVLHQTVSTVLKGNLQGFLAPTTPATPTCIHYLVDIDGHVVKCVDEFWESNHAGRSAWEGRRGVNDYSVGIETIHTDADPAGKDNDHRPERFTFEQYKALIRLLGELKHTYAIDPRRILGHNQVLLMGVSKPNPKFPKDRTKDIPLGHALHYDRRECPGSMFEWQRLEERGCALARIARKPNEPPARKALFDGLEKIQAISQYSKNADVKAIKQLLMDIGYWVALKPVARANLTERYDLAMLQAILAFQARTFSGRRRAYVIKKGDPKPPNPPGATYGTLDNQTIRAIIETWVAIHG